MDYKDLIRALRCSSSVHYEAKNCLECKYGAMDPIDPTFPAKADVIIDEVGYWLGCDADQICIDAADALYKLTTLNPQEDKL